MNKALRAALKCAAFLGVWALLISAVFGAFLAIGGPEVYERASMRFAIEAAMLGAALAALAFMAGVIDKRGFDSWGFRLGAAGPGLLGGTLLGGLIFAAPMAILVGLGAASFAPDWSGFTAAGAAYSLVFCLINAAHQEVLVRSYLFQELWGKFGAWTAAIVTTVLFVALHAPLAALGSNGVLALVNVGLASLMLSLAYVRTRALWAPIGIHFGWNGLQGPILGVDVSGQKFWLGEHHAFAFGDNALLTGGAAGVEGGLAGLAGPLIGLGILAAALRPLPARN